MGEEVKKRGRLLVIDGERYQYVVRKCGGIVIWNEDDRKVVLEGTDAWNMTNHDIEKGLWKGWFQIKPSDVAELIRRLESEAAFS